MANTPINAMTATFGSGDQTAIKMNVTDSGPADNTSKLIDLQLGSVTKFKVTKLGQVIATNYTGSFSGSTFVKNQSSDVGTKYLVFTNGTGQRTLGLDTTLTYDASSNTLSSNGSANFGGDIDSTNAYPLLMGSPTSLNIASSATTILIGSSSPGSYTHFYSKEVRGNFTGSFKAGSFTGSISGSVGKFNSFITNNITSSISGAYAAFTKITGSSGTITGRLIANSFTGSISGAYAAFTKITGSSGRITGRLIANSFTGSISGAYAAFTKITGSSGTITGKLIANSFTGSISGAYAAFTKITGSVGRIENNLVVNGTLQIFNPITGSNLFLSGAGSPIAGYVGIMIDGTKYKLPLYPWS